MKPTIPPPWGPYVLVPSAPNDVDAISETIDVTFESAIEHGLGIFDLESLRPEQVHGEHLAAVLRALSTWKDEVLGWHHALDVARIALGADADDALYGLTH